MKNGLSPPRKGDEVLRRLHASACEGCPGKKAPSSLLQRHPPQPDVFDNLLGVIAHNIANSFLARI